MIDDSVRSVLTCEGPATFVTLGPGGPHLVATWQSYLDVLDDATLAFPAGRYFATEANLKADPRVQMIVGAQTAASTGKALGFRLSGTAALEVGTSVHERLKERFPWCRAAVVLRVARVERVLG